MREESEKERTEGERSEMEGRRIARGQNGKREQKTRENYGLPRSRPRRHGAHCLAGYLRGNIDPSLSLLPLPSGSPFDHLSHWDTKVERTKLAAISSRFRARSGTTVPPPHHFMVGCRVPRRLPPGASLAHNDRDEREKKKEEDGVLLLLPGRARSRAFTRGPAETIRVYVHTYFNMYM